IRIAGLAHANVLLIARLRLRQQRRKLALERTQRGRVLRDEPHAIERLARKVRAVGDGGHTREQNAVEQTQPESHSSLRQLRPSSGGAGTCDGSSTGGPE